MTTVFRKLILATATLAGLVGAVLPASAQGWGDGGWDRGREGGWRPHHHHRDRGWDRGWDRPHCWMETRRVWIDTRWGPEQRAREVRVCR